MRNNMKKNWVWLLALGLSACGKQLEIASDVTLKHQYDAAFQRQVQVLQAEQVKVSSTKASSAGPAMLALEVLNPHNPPEQHPDTLKQRMHKLAHLLAADLASPASYQVLNAQATFKHSLFSRDNSTSSQAFIYPIATLR
jgi:hypothetical protein